MSLFSFTEMPEKLERLGGKIANASIWESNFIRVVAAALAVLLLAIVIAVPLDLVQQSVIAVIAFVAASKLRRLSWGRGGILIMIGISLLMTLRYLYWRLTVTLEFETTVDAVFGYLLLFAELYGITCLVLGYIQTAWPLERQPVMIDRPTSEWPSVDIFIPTFNEDLSVVRLSVLAALTLDWPADKLRVYLLDDGRREEFREFAQSCGAIYFTRDNNRHAKAGNLNEALKRTNGDFVAIFDCDHIPTRSFLQLSMGSFLRDPKLAMVQTPHFFFSPDPFERNLETHGKVPNEGQLFYGLVQDGNDIWNASFFCGSCAVLRRAPLEEIGGVAVETVTEDAHTALKMSRRGYNMAYLAVPQAAGLATENLSSHVGQRIRWARGMAQIFRIDNPLFGPGLTLGQRLCYVNAMLHFFYGLPRLIFLSAPVAYLVFGAHVFTATTSMVLVYALPAIVLASMTNSKIQGNHRHSFWNEVYETVLAWYISMPVLMALLNPKWGKFNVTAKGGKIDQEYYDWKMAVPYVLLLAVNAICAVFGITELLRGSDEPFTALINCVWVVYNTVILSASAYVANESRQIRHTPRIKATFPATVSRANGRTVMCETANFSSTGLGLKLPKDNGIKWDIGERVHVSIFRGEKESTFPGTVQTGGQFVGIQFDDSLTLKQTKELAKMTFGRADMWATEWDKHTEDKPMTSIKNVVGHGFVNLYGLIRSGIRGAFVKRRA
jgi:cellulose synthase (UDP-forming)